MPAKKTSKKTPATEAEALAARNKHQGLHSHRLGTSPDEERFAGAWADLQETTSTLQYLLCPPEKDQHFAPEPSERDSLVAGTVGQWLGSPSGQFFLRVYGLTSKVKK